MCIAEWLRKLDLYRAAMGQGIRGVSEYKRVKFWFAEGITLMLQGQCSIVQLSSVLDGRMAATIDWSFLTILFEGLLRTGLDVPARESTSIWLRFLPKCRDLLLVSQ